MAAVHNQQGGAGWWYMKRLAFESMVGLDVAHPGLNSSLAVLRSLLRLVISGSSVQDIMDFKIY